jgi:hypothetical protein
MKKPFTTAIPVFIAGLLALSLSLAGCQAGPESPPAAQSETPPGDKTAAEKAVPAHLFFSPNGEPLNGGPLGWPSCGAAVRGWFAKIDLNHDGAINREEFIADARTQFTTMDIDHNGMLLPEELARYRAPYREGTGQLKKLGEKPDDQPEDTVNGPGGSFGGGRRAHKHGEGETFSDIVADPVMAADTSLDNRVTLDEFLAHANKTFDGLVKPPASATPSLALNPLLSELCK